MNVKKISVSGIPAVIWGEKSSRVFVAAHGYLSNKMDTIIRLLAETATARGFQVLSFDLPEHGERQQDGVLCTVPSCVQELVKILEYAGQQWERICFFGCSMGAYFGLLACRQNSLLQSCLFLSPVLDMNRIIQNSLTRFHITAERLEQEKIIQTPVGQTLYWDDYRYVKNHPIVEWRKPTAILYGMRDNLCEPDVVHAFAEKFHCQLQITEQGEHYFHTDAQLQIFREWLEKQIPRNTIKKEYVK